MKQDHLGTVRPLLAALLLLAFAACGGASKTGSASIDSTRLRLDKVEVGRLVDVYAYRRIDTNHRGDRRDRFNRQPVLVARDVVVNPALESQSLFDPAGELASSANFEFRPFDVATGHEELLILWDDRSESAQFQAALAQAQEGLIELPAAFRNQNTQTRPIPVIPRNAALVLHFIGRLTLSESFFAINPSAVQLLEFKGDPATVPAQDAFRAIPFRAVPRGNTIILDPTLLGGEAQGGFLSAGMPPSPDNVTANIRIAIPSRGEVSPAFFVREDVVPELNGVDSFGRDAVIRDFRSGNEHDGTAGALRDLESPMIVGAIGMGITAVDPATNEVTLNKRFHELPVRARYPFVEGTLRVDSQTGEVLPLGPAGVPTAQPLRTGDFLEQVVQHTNRLGVVENVRVRAEILWNESVGTVRDDPAFPGAGLAADGTQGEALPTTTLRLATVAAGIDSLGDPVSFTALAPGQTTPPPAGQDCVVRALYYEHVRFLLGGSAVSDATRRYEYLHVDPEPPVTIGGNPVTPGTHVDPNASFAIEFTEPMDIERVDPTTNLVVTNTLLPDRLPSGEDFATLIQNAKLATAGVVPTRLSDQKGDATVPALQPPKGLFHRQSQAETYWFHLLLGSRGLTDLGGNAVEVFADPSQPIRDWSASIALEPDADTNLVGWRVFRFEDIDEDGTLPGSVDMFGQFRLQDGRLVAAETLRFSRTADANNLGTISRILRGECWDTVNHGQLTPLNPPSGGVLYFQPRMVDVVFPPNVPPVFLPPNSPQNVGHVVEPHQPRGSRMMMRYIEDDFDLSYRLPNDFMLDVEQLYWSPFNDEDILFDVFDRYTMLLSHSDKRPDLFFFVNPQGANGPECQLACPSVASSLRTTFLDNLLRGTSQTPVFEDKVYQINPNDAFRSPLNVKYIAYPRFDRSYTWRDSRLISVDNAGNVVGLGGARDPRSPEPNNDFTANIDSPWVPSVPDDPQFPGNVWVLDNADFRGDRRRDHDPIALPLLVDFKMFPDGAANGLARGSNGFQMAMIGSPSNFLLGNPGGYYNIVGVGCPNRDPWPMTRVHTTGGIDPNTNQDIIVDPANSFQATGGWIKDAGAIVIINTGVAGSGPLGIFRAPPGDGMINWAQADFVRRVSSMTFGFFDTLQPNRRQVAGAGGPQSDNGIPNFLDPAITAQFGDLRILDFATQLDPPRSRQPAGTSIVLEIRGATTFANSNVLYDPITNDTVPVPPTAGGRGNLLNPNYACEAYRYAQANSGQNGDTPRVAATGLSRYVTEDRIGDIREPATGLLPRFLNLRLVMTNNIDVSPALSPSLRSMSVIYRMQSVP